MASPAPIAAGMLLATLLSASLVTSLVTSGGCTLQRPMARRDDCSAFRQDCAPRRPTSVTAGDGETSRRVRIDSEPTPAAIYLNGAFIGYSPMHHRIGFGSTDRAISLVAVPLYPGQAQQQRLIRIPPLPARVSFFMNNPPPEDADSSASTSPVSAQP
ncbi:MAG: hypothetical protein LJE69_14170 [Thiohalocapsa sp.]|jgi:hypothetical protein|uniref:hypothetical protein n=1 Tax=Thiohalocapsa sp. TaxID=2497641 RepID=UPI0025D440ED|nr:hypothetical protein [Thiohalocapsa sp.]MCG6942383.1 hypothetical protein [Thiohalocapsa sp.]